MLRYWSVIINTFAAVVRCAVFPSNISRSQGNDPKMEVCMFQVKPFSMFPLRRKREGGCPEGLV